MNYSQQDGGYAYVIAIASFIGQILECGIVWTVGVFYEVFNDMFPGNSGAVALISSINTSAFYIAGE